MIKVTITHIFRNDSFCPVSYQTAKIIKNKEIFPYIAGTNALK